MDDRLRAGRLFRSPRILGAVEEVAACQPVAGLHLPKDDRIEESAIWNIKPDHPSPALIKVGKRQPGLERLFAEVARERLGAHVRADTIEDQPTVADNSAAEQLAVETADAVTRVRGKSPTSKRRRERGGQRGKPALLERRGPGRLLDPIDRHVHRGELGAEGRCLRRPLGLHCKPSRKRFRRIEPGGHEARLDRGFERGELGVGGPEGLRSIEDHLARAAAHENPVEGVEILLRYEIELVVVAAGAGGGEPKESL